MEKDITKKLEGESPMFTPACKHDAYCNRLVTLDKAHCSEDFIQTCDQAKIYNKWGEGWNEMGVGL